MTRAGLAVMLAFWGLAVIAPGTAAAQISYVCEHGRPANSHCSQCNPSRPSAPSGGGSESRAYGERPDNGAQLRRAHDLNRQAVAAAREGDWETAVRYLREALALDPSNDTIKQNHAEAQAALARLRQEEAARKEAEALRNQAQADASRSLQYGLANLRDLLNQISHSGSGSGGGSGAVRPAAGGQPDPGRLEFVPFVDSSVVDLRDARTGVVDPARVRGGDRAVFASRAAFDQLRAAAVSGDDDPRKQAHERIRETVAKDLEVAAQIEHRRWERVAVDLEPQRRELVAAQERIARKQLEDLKALRDNYDRDLERLLARIDSLKPGEDPHEKAKGDDGLRRHMERIAAEMEKAYVEDVRQASGRGREELGREFRRILGFKDR